MSRRFVLEREGRLFGAWLTDLLNGTVSNGVRLEFAFSKYHQVARIYTEKRPIRLSVDARKAPCHLTIEYILGADDSGRFLMVKSSYVGLFRDPAAEELLLHYDYERNKGGGYPEAHLQVHATSGSWSGLTDRTLSRLHLPVGGRRFRPSLEDLIEFMIVEGLVEGRDGWEQLIERGRSEYRRTQLNALTRSNPTDAAETLRDMHLMA